MIGIKNKEKMAMGFPLQQEPERRFGHNGPL